MQPSGTNIRITHGHWEAVTTEIGAGLRVLRRSDVDLIDGYAEHEQASGGRGQLLIPWPNRIEDGRYDWDGATQQLPITEPDRHNASHGLTRWVAWRLAEETDASSTWTYPLRPQPGYRHALDLTATYTLTDGGLVASVTATNVGDEPAPYAFGAHPYLTVGRRVDECELTVPARRFTDIDERGLPGNEHDVAGGPLDFRAPRTIGATVIDHPFTALEGEAIVRLRDPDSDRSVELWADEACGWRQVFTGDTLGDRARQSLAVEPMTAPPNAFRSRRDLNVVQPGHPHTATWGIR